MAIEEILQAGKAAAKAGDLERAAAFFAQVVKTDPSCEEGWFWLGQCCPSQEQREYCLRRVLSLNPGNIDARQRLEWMKQPAPFSPAAQPAPPPSSQPSSWKASPPPKPSLSPFVFDEREDSSPQGRPLQDASPSSRLQEPHAGEISLFPTPPSHPQEKAAAPSPKRKQGSKALAVLLPIILILVFGGLVIGYLYFSGDLNNFIPSSLVPARALPSAASLASNPPTLTPTPSPSETSIPPTPTPTATAVPTIAPTIAYTPESENKTCDFQIPEGISVNCYYISIPENRTNPHSEKIKLSVAVYHSTNSNPSPVPALFLQGGPGGEAVQLAAGMYKTLVAPFLADRDFITYDQRGTGESIPELGCQELKDVFKEDIHGQIPSSGRDMIYSNAFISCHGAMSVSGVNLNAYTTEASAADIKDILSVLGYKKVDLYGASYGTRLAQVVMRDYPDIVESVVVDSVVPIETKFFNSLSQGTTSSLQALFKTCAADPQCNASFPSLESEFWQEVDNLEASPVSLTGPISTGGTIKEEVTGSTFLNIIVGLLHYSYISPIPQVISQIKNGDLSSLIDIQYFLPDEFADISPGLYISMMCHEQLLATTPAQLKKDLPSSQSEWEFAMLPFYGTVDDYYKVCKDWGSVSPSPGENDPVISNIPTLVIAGKFDPTTPPIWGELLASHLSDSYYYEFPNAGHTPTASDSTGCAMKMVISFFKDPTHAPDSSCLGAIKPVQFALTYTGNPPIRLKTVQENGLTAKVPVGWTEDEFEPGAYYRENSDFDLTELIIYNWPFERSQDILDSLSSYLQGYAGFDAPPVAAGTRQANGMTWTLYTLSSYGRPVNLALANRSDGRGALGVLIFCHSDERQAFLQTLYLPVIDSVVPYP